MLAIIIGFGTYVTIFSIKDFKKEISDLQIPGLTPIPPSPAV